MGTRPLFAGLLIAGAQLVAHAQTRPSQEAAVADLFGVGRGFAAGLAASLPPSATGKQSVAMRGFRVTVNRTDAGLVPLVLEAKSPEAVAVISKTLFETTRNTLVGSLGTPKELYDGSLRYAGPSQGCAEYVDVSFRGERLAGITWRFCSE
jgi:hypothetical protein